MTAITIIAWYLLQIVSLVSGARSATCFRGWFVDGAFADSTFRCSLTPPPSVCPGPMGCDDDSEDPHAYGVLACRADERALTNWDGRSVYCGRDRSAS